ncbi:MAG: hypothetical protein IPG50_19460 [Myxococcales bacterium]|nr:hypothetical protein [Myxococcales bacterium]
MYARGVSRPSLAPYRSAPDGFGPLHVELAPYGLGLLGAYVMPGTLVVVAAGPGLVAAIIWRETQAIGALLVAVGLLTLGVTLAIVAIVRAPSRRARVRFYERGLEFDDGRRRVQRCRYTDIVEVRRIEGVRDREATLEIELADGRIVVPAIFDHKTVQGRLAVARRHRRLTGGDGSAVDLNSEGT